MVSLQLLKKLTLTLLLLTLPCVAQVLQPGQGGTGNANTATFKMGSANWDLSTYGGGIPKISGSGAGGLSQAGYADVVGMWASGSCTGFLKYDGTCPSSAGGGISGVDMPADLFSGTPCTSGTCNFTKTNQQPNYVMMVPPAAGPLTPTILQTVNCASTTNVASITCTITALHAGSLVYAAGGPCNIGNCGGTGTGTLSSFTVSDGTNTYTTLDSNTSTAVGYYSAYSANVSAGATSVTLTMNGSSPLYHLGLTVIEVANVGASSPLDQHAAGNTCVTVSAPLTNGNATDIVLGVCDDLGESASFTQNPGWSLVSQNATTYYSMASVFQNTSTAGTFSPNVTTSGSNQSRMLAASFAAATGGGAASYGLFPFSFLAFTSAVPGLSGLSPASSSGASGIDLQVGAPIEITGQTSAYPGNNSASTLATTQSTGPSAYHCWVAVNCHSSTSVATIVPQLLYTDTSNTAETLTGGTATCTTLGTNSTSNNEWPIYVYKSTTIYLKTTLANSPTYDVHAECSLANTQ